MKRSVLSYLGCALAVLAWGGCAAGPAPIVVYEDARQSIWLKFDPEADPGHDHPAVLTPEQVATVLRGVRVKHRDVLGGGGLFAEHNSAPAFSPREVVLLAPHLSRALQKASPKDIVTFYLTTYDPEHGTLVTSGGLFIRKGRMFVILANSRTSPGSIQYENTYAIDTRDQPLLPIARYKFVAGFVPEEAWIPNAQARGKEGYEGYLDESKLIVIDLARLFGQPTSPASASQP